MLKQWLGLTGASLLAFAGLGCVSVVVNVYFPESEARDALAALEEEILGMPVTPAPSPGGANGTAPQEEESRTGMRIARPLAGVVSEWVVPTASAASDEEILQKIKDMPEVLAAYDRLKARLPRTDALRDAKLVGEGSNGLLAWRTDAGTADKKDRRTVDDENADRAVIMDGLAAATLKAAGEPDTPENRRAFRAGAERTFAQLRREKARSGWWIQGADGSWSQKP